ncbi:hypothetical protein [Aestuariimicrobium ganziense]|uniref:hypothetical protein n=1 Tax=Aestuariimicrobium ganziense TaxID=2773677 RepID=UPI00194293B8|nr:hypothetical protein [Aestuariimicrobium ganziense]
MAEPRREAFWKPVIGFLVLLLVIGAMAVAGWRWISSQQAPTLRIEVDEQCVATVNGESFRLNPEPARNAGIIAAEGMRRGLPARAVTIALATAMQESSLRNIDHGDRDSVGLFQQRPSQGWGTVDQIMDPWYSAGKFYEALVKVPGWQTGDVNDIAQKVQRSGHPDAYRKHEPMARAWASALTGHSPGAIGCVRHDPASTMTTLNTVLAKAHGTKAKVTAHPQGLVITASDPVVLWSSVHLAMSQYDQVRFVRVEVAGRAWAHDDYSVAAWGALPTPGTSSESPSGGSTSEPLPASGPTTAVLALG